MGHCLMHSASNGKRSFALKVVVPAHRALIVRVSINDNLIDDACLAPRLDFLASHPFAL
jgi:hypothetical protein